MRRCSLFLLSLLLTVPASASANDTACVEAGGGGATLVDQHHRACVPGYSDVVVCERVIGAGDTDAAYVRVCYPGVL